MQPFELLQTAHYIVLIVVNTLFILILIGQFRESKKPSITTHVVSSKKEEYEHPDVLESSSAFNSELQYIRIINKSKNEAKKVTISYKMSLESNPDSVIENTEKLDYLNPFEMTQILLRTDIFRDNNPDKFESFDVNDTTTLIRPKSHLKIYLDISVEYNPLIFGFIKHASKDNYTINWNKFDSEPYERFDCWNKRNGHHIFKKTVSQNKDLV
ncbi:hypothetical protein [Methanohalophilus sp. WG1-DM]|uniref:hypothetical protein n=1 Tax=Methanohalophilus sp. WG1-DM TaxID=2491675 RepID=UPI000FFEC0E7|nr:hypothetical protein [Methanohalophilus sp. WG1-DM]RXG35032.1 hypothetical protein CI957_56 [Methanohalophilus sp. WG1-DM]